MGTFTNSFIKNEENLCKIKAMLINNIKIALYDNIYNKFVYSIVDNILLRKCN